jgi:hypothetical protein
MARRLIRHIVATCLGLSLALTVALASARPAPAVAQGGSYLGSIGEMAGWIGGQIRAFQPSKGGASTSAEPHVRNETSTATVGGRPVTRQSTYRIVMATDRDTITFIIDRTERYAVTGPTPEAPQYEVRDGGGTTLQVDACPDEDGTITVTANASGTYDVIGDDLAYHASLDTREAATATVDAAAELAGREHSLTVRGSATGDRPAFAGGDGAVDSSLAAAATWSGDTGTPPQVSITTAEGVDARDLRASFFGGFATAALVDMAIDAAETVWQDGRCLELVVEPPGKRVDPGSETEITVTIEHKAFDEGSSATSRRRSRGPRSSSRLTSPSWHRRRSRTRPPASRRARVPSPSARCPTVGSPKSAPRRTSSTSGCYSMPKDP